VRRLRIVPPRQLPLLPAPCAPEPAMVWVTLPKRNREVVLALLARLIAAGVVGGGGEEQVS
jgi:hypothetical protein